MSAQHQAQVEGVIEEFDVGAPVGPLAEDGVQGVGQTDVEIRRQFRVLPHLQGDAGEGQGRTPQGPAPRGTEIKGQFGEGRLPLGRYVEGEFRPGPREAKSPGEGVGEVGRQQLGQGDDGEGRGGLDGPRVLTSLRAGSEAKRQLPQGQP